MRNLIFLAIVPYFLYGCNPGKQNEDSHSEDQLNDFQPFVEQLDPDLKEVVDPSAKVEIIADGFEWSEGPLWINELGLLFSDIPPNKIYLWKEEEGVKLYLFPSGYTGETPREGEVGANGLLVDYNGQLVLCQHGDRRLARMISPMNDPKPEFETIVDHYNGMRFNSPNDACFNSKGELYFTDPPYGLEKMMSDPSKELDFQGVYKFTSTGQLKLLTDEMTRPNGIAFSPDEKILYVANSDPEFAVWMAFTLNDDGMIESKRVFHDATFLVEKEAGLPDGLKIDSNGNIFATGPGGVWIFNEQGKVLGKIRTGQATSNCAFGNDGKMLYITADMYIMRVRLNA